MVDVRADQAENLLDTFPPSTSPLRMERFFDVLYRHYDERNVVSAPDLATRNRRIEWSPDSPALADHLPANIDYDVRVSNCPAGQIGQMSAPSRSIMRRFSV